ncbi:MAG: TetR/AcrR family transcriptional regulator [Pseudomonadota bacterium]
MSDMKQTIKEAATELFYRKGYFATSISEIATACGIQKASIYYHYTSKEALLYSIMATTMDDLVAYLSECLGGLSPVEAKIRAAVRAHVSFHLNRQKENFIANTELRGLSPEHYDDIVAKRDAYERIFQDLLARGRDEGVFGQWDVKILSYAVLALCTSGAFWFQPGGRLSVDDIAGIYERFILKGIT